MILAKDKYGRIGRKVPGVGAEAKVDHAREGERRGNVYLSLGSIETDQAYWANKENEERALHQGEAFANKIRRKAKELEAQRQKAITEQFQRVAKIDPMNERLKNFYARKGMMGEDARVQASIAPADFSSSGGNVQYVNGEPMTGGQQWSADYRQHFIRGNPLTRDGVFGPGTTDYDRFVNGIDVNQTDIVAGGTMLGRYDGTVAPAGQGQRSLRRMNGMGWEWPTWDSITSTAGDIIDKTSDQLINDLPAHLSEELKNIVAGGGSVQPSSGGGGTIVVQRPPTQAPSTMTTMASSMGLPPAVLYGFLGLFAVGILFIGYKAVKS